MNERICIICNDPLPKHKKKYCGDKCKDVHNEILVMKGRRKKSNKRI